MKHIVKNDDGNTKIKNNIINHQEYFLYQFTYRVNK